MTPRRIRIQPCGEPQARQRLARACSFLEVAELTADENDPSLEYGSVAASIAILAGIAAADAVCCQKLGGPRSLRQAKSLVALAKEVIKG